MLTFIRIYPLSVYTARNLKPSAKDLADVDVVLFDISDIGARFYTYLWTLTHILEACKENRKRLFVLDRPNPIGLDLNQIEGPFLDEQNCSSFIGRWNIPLRHSCTLGELALYFNSTKNINASLTVIKCEQLSRADFFPDFGINFTPTSPAITNFNAAILYPGIGFLEATNLTEGRGTTMSFEMVAAPWLTHGANIIDQFENLHIETIITKPEIAKYAGEICNGFFLSPKNYKSYSPVKTGLLLIKLIKDNYPSQFKWQPYVTNANPTGAKHLDKLLGVSNSEQLFELHISIFKEIINDLCNAGDFRKEIEPYLLYT